MRTHRCRIMRCGIYLSSLINVMKQISTLFSFILLFITAYAAPPTVPSSNLTFNGLDGAQFTGTFTHGNGTYRIIVMKEGSPVTGLPLNGVEYSSNPVFGTAAAQFTAPGEYVVAKTSWNNFTVSNLKPGTVYYIAVFEYNGSGTS